MTVGRRRAGALVQRDMRDVAGIDRLDPLPRLLRALAQIAGQMCNDNPGRANILPATPAYSRFLWLKTSSKNFLFIQPAPLVIFNCQRSYTTCRQ